MCAVNNASVEVDNARKILKTYHQVHDTPSVGKPKKGSFSVLQEKNRELQKELSAIREKYTQLQVEYARREERLLNLNRQLVDKTSDITRLQEDFENAIFQLSQNVNSESNKK